ncbi:MAG: HPr family phosphocarrier protein [Mariprofundales bacterium]
MTQITLKNNNELLVCHKVCIKNLHGLHTRPSISISELAKQFSSKIWFEYGTKHADTSILQLMTLEAHQGVELNICALGQDADLAVLALISLLENYKDQD